MHKETLKKHGFLEIIPPGRHDAVTSSRLHLNRYQVVSFVNVFKYTPLGVSGPKNKIDPKPEVSHEKVFALDIAFTLD